MTLSIQPPRAYRLRDAYDRRVWRTGLGQLARDGLVTGVATAGCGFAYVNDALLYGGVLAALLSLAAHLGWNLRANLLRTSLLRTAPAADATIGRARRVLFVHELFRGPRERTWVLPYTYEVPEVGDQRGRVFICGCVRDRFPEGSSEPVAYDPDRPQRSVPLRLAVMVAPH